MHRIKKNLRVLSAICLMFLTVVSCTQDYFLDETTFRLYIPQLKERTLDPIDNVYVFFHSADGSHVLTRSINSSTVRDTLMKQGILRFKLPPGEGYTITGGANTQNSIVGGNNNIEKSSILAEPWKEVAQEEGDAYKTLSQNTEIRVLSLTPVTVYPLTHPNGQVLYELNLNDSTKYGSRITVNFENLPQEVERVEVKYYGLATQYNFYSKEFTRKRPTDYYLSKTLKSEMTSTDATTQGFTHMVFPSDGTSASTTGNEQPINLDVRFIDAGGNVIMSHNLDEDGYPGYTIDGVAKDSWIPGEHAQTLKPRITLRNRGHLVLRFKGWTIFSLTLAGWGAIVEGTPTPM